MLKYVDTFCGIGGFSLAIANVTNGTAKRVLAIDFDPKVVETFKNNFEEDCLGDIRKLEVESVPDHDILFGGFSCQPFSRNGKWYNKNNRTIGEDEDRDNLFLELVRILNGKKPKYFLFENVKGLISMKNRDGTLYFDTIKENLIGCGYNLYTQVLDAADYGLPQQRERIFFVGIRNDLDQSFEFPNPIKRKSCIADILESNVDQKYFLSNLWKNRIINGNAKEENVGKKNHDFPKGSNRYEVLKSIYDKAVKPIYPTFQIESVAILYGDTPSGLPRQQDKIYSIMGIAPTIATFSTPAIDSNEGLRQLTPRECMRLQGFPDSYKMHPKDALAYKQAGNAVAVPVVEAILRNLLKEIE